MALFEITTGDDVDYPAQLTKNGATFTIDPGATVKGCIKYEGEAISAEVTCDNAHPDADWVNSLVIVPFTAVQTEAITKTGLTAYIEIQVDDGGKLTWDRTVRIEKGVIA